MSRKTYPGRWFARVALHLALLAAAALALLPLIWLLCAAFKNDGDMFSCSFLPWKHLDTLTLDNFRQLFRITPLLTWLFNSLFLASAQTCLIVTCSSLGGFALAKYRFRGRRWLMLLMLLTMMLPGQLLLPSLWEEVFHFGWIDSYAAILVPGAVTAFGMFLFRQAMLGVPDELLHAGRIDGCSELRLWWSVALPLVRPMIGAYTLMSFLASWNNFLWPQTVLQSESKYTLPIALSNMLALPGYTSQYGMLMAATLISILPVMILFFALQKDFVAGLASGAVKG